MFCFEIFRLYMTLFAVVILVLRIFGCLEHKLGILIIFALKKKLLKVLDSIVSDVNLDELILIFQ